MAPIKSHGTGRATRKQFAHIGENVVIERGVLVFHPEHIHIGDNVYIGHNSILKGYYKNSMIIGNGTWIGQQCFFHSAGGITIGADVGIGPAVKIITSFHQGVPEGIPIMKSPLVFKPVIIEDGADIGVSSTILPGVTIGKGAQVGAGAVVTSDVDPYTIVAGVPARFMRNRIEDLHFH